MYVFLTILEIKKIFFFNQAFAIEIIVMARFIIQRCCFYSSYSTTIMSCMVLFCPICLHLCPFQNPLFCLAFWNYKSLQQLGRTFRESKLCIYSLPLPKLSLEKNHNPSFMSICFQSHFCCCCCFLYNISFYNNIFL